VLIVCGGVRTEPTYFKGLKQAFRNPAVVVKVVAEPRDPEAVVRAARLHLESGDFDAAWCVLDVDEFRFERALKDAREHGISLAVSNPCFEVWLLLHRADLRTPFPTAKDVLVRLRSQLPHYEKSGLRFADFEDHVVDAITRARSLPGAEQVLGPNPTSGVWRVIQAVLPA